MRSRAVALFALVGCSSSERSPAPPPPAWVYPPPLVMPWRGPVAGTIGRSQPPQHGELAGITGDVGGPLRSPTPWAVPGDGPARAVIDGFDDAQSVVELIDVDAGAVLWRDPTTCKGRVVGVTSKTIVCADAGGVRGLGLDGKPAWSSAASVIAITEDRVVARGADGALVLDANTGAERTRVMLPAEIGIEGVVASCGDGRELFTVSETGSLARIADVAGKPAVTWTVPTNEVASIEACTGAAVLALIARSDRFDLIAIDRATGATLGTVADVRGYWPARDGSDRIEVATVAGVASWSRDLVSPGVATGLPPVGELLSSRGDRRLVRSSPLTAVLLDRNGVRAYLAFGARGAVLGDAAILGATSSGAQTVHRLGLPGRYPRVLRLPSRRAGVAVPAELRDLPPVTAIDDAAVIPSNDAHASSVTAVAIDPMNGAVVYATPHDQAAGKVGARVASADLARRRWRWQRADGCGPGTPIGLAVAGDVVVCAARGTKPATSSLRATAHTGEPRWQWTTAQLDFVQGAGDVVLAAGGDRAHVIDAETGRVLQMITSDDGGNVRAALIAIDHTPVVVAYERGRLVARLARAGLIAIWSIEVNGSVRRVSASDSGVLVELEDGDAFRIDAVTRRAYALAGLGIDWGVAGDLVTGEIAGGPVPAEPPPVPPEAAQRRPRDIDRPAMAIPVAPPPPVGDSWQYTLYELSGGLRARNDYAIAPPITHAVRGSQGSLLAIAYGAGAQEVLVLDPRSGDPMRRVRMPADGASGRVFSTIVDGAPVTGAVLPAPLRIVLF
ncbi:MAG: hypothetical protein AB7P03_13720 [Kofleriaceae bacterium]